MATTQRRHLRDLGEKKFALVGELCTAPLAYDAEKGEVLPPRRFITVDMTFEEAVRFFEPSYYDPNTGKGSQREQIRSHVNKLRREMRNGHFTPTPWAATLRASHQKNLEINERTGTVTVPLTERTPLSLIDGGHRRQAMLDLIELYEKDNFAEAVDAVRQSIVTVVVHLHPELEKSDFRHLQEGKAVDRSQLNMMREDEKDINPKNAPMVRLARLLAGQMNADNRSFLFNEIAWMKSTRFTGRVQYAVITNPGASDIAVKLTGGAKVVLFGPHRHLFPQDQESFEKAATAFLRDCYIRVYEGIKEYGKQVTVPIPATDERQTFPELFGPDRVLTPINLNGSLGGTGLLVMLGNMLAARTLLVRGKPEIDDRDVRSLVRAAEMTLNEPARGKGSTSSLRELTADFVREYFEDVVRKSPEDEHKKHFFDAYRGIPEILTRIFSPSTLDLRKEEIKLALLAHEQQVIPPNRDPIDATPEYLESEEAPSALDQDEFTPPMPKDGQPKKRGRRGQPVTIA